MLVNRENLDVINTAFFTEISKSFRDIAPGTWSQFTHMFQATGTSVDVVVQGGFPRPRTWTGAKQFKDSRAYKRNFALTAYEASTILSVDDVNQDVSGAVAGGVTEWVNQSSMQFFDSLVFTSLLSNPTGYDGVSLMNDTHANVGGSGTSDNLTTSALSFANFRTGYQALREMKDEYGATLNVRPTHLLAGPAQEELSQQVTGSEKPVALSDAGEPATSSTETSNLMVNYIGGAVSVIISAEITGNEWFLMDLSKGPRKPMLLAEFESVHGDVKDDPKDDCVFYDNEIHYSIVAKAAIMPGDWHMIYGSVTT